MNQTDIRILYSSKDDETVSREPVPKSSILNDIKSTLKRGKDGLRRSLSNMSVPIRETVNNGRSSLIDLFKSSNSKHDKSSYLDNVGRRVKQALGYIANNDSPGKLIFHLDDALIDAALADDARAPVITRSTNPVPPYMKSIFDSDIVPKIPEWKEKKVAVSEGITEGASPAAETNSRIHEASPPAVPRKSHSARESEAATRKRHIRELLAGTYELSKEFHDKYELQELLGDGAFGFVITAVQISTQREVAIKFIVKCKIPRDVWIQEAGGERLPLEIHNLRTLRHQNIIGYVEHLSEREYILLISELHGCSWDPTNPILNQKQNPGLKFAMKSAIKKQTGVRKRTSCDLFECIDARTHLF